MRARFCLMVFLGAACGGCGSRATTLDPRTAARLEEEARVGGYTIIEAAQMADLIKERADMVILDVRPEVSYREKHLLGATNVPFPAEEMTGEWKNELMGGATAEDFKNQLGKDLGIRVVIYGQDFEDPRAHNAATWARKLGFKDVRRFAGGLAAWTAFGQPTRSLKE